MRITVNGDPADHQGSLADLVAARLGDATKRGIAVALNDEVVARGSWATCFPNPGDRIEIVTAVQGG